MQFLQNGYDTLYDNPDKGSKFAMFIEWQCSKSIILSKSISVTFKYVTRFQMFKIYISYMIQRLRNIQYKSLYRYFISIKIHFLYLYNFFFEKWAILLVYCRLRATRYQSYRYERRRTETFLKDFDLKQKPV